MKNKKQVEGYDYIIVLCPEINPEDKGNFSNFKHRLYLGGHIRMEAAYNLYNQNKKANLILVADYNKDDGSPNSSYSTSGRTASMKTYLLKLGIPEINLLTINSLPCTKHNLIAVFNRFQAAFENKKIALLTNLYHLPRSLSFWIELKKLKKYARIPNLPNCISAENLVNDDARYKKSRLYIDRLEMEAEGVVDLLLGRYQDGCIKSVNAKNNKTIVRDDYKKITAKEGKNLL